jgi:hypothetical protein
MPEAVHGDDVLPVRRHRQDLGTGGGSVVERAARMVCGRDEKEGGAASLYSGGRRIGNGSVGRNKASADGHTAMRGETLHCAT